MAQLLHMPEVAAGSTTAVLASWAVAENDAFTTGATLAEIETDKAVIDLPAEGDGRILKLLVAPGSAVNVGDPIALLGSDAEHGVDIAALLAAAGVGPVDRTMVATPAPADTPRPPAPADPDPSIDEVRLNPEGPADPEGPDVPGANGLPRDPASHPTGRRAPGPMRVFASPLARRLARDAGVPLEQVGPGSGPGGRIRRTDVETAIAATHAGRPQPAGTGPAAGAAPPAAAPDSVPSDPRPDGRATRPHVTNTQATPPAAAGPTPTGFTDQPHSKVRRAIAARLTESKQTVPHFYLGGSVRVDGLLALRKELNTAGTSRISVNDLIVKAAARVHAAMPEMNVIWTPDALRRFDDVDVSVAIASTRGLVTPTLRAADRMSVGAVSAAVKDLAARADEGKLRQHELEGGSLSVTNLGMFGTEDFNAIINPPQSAILAVGAAKEQAVVVDGRLEVGTVMRVSLSVDHRAIDGRLAAEWLRAFVASVEQPLQILT